MRTARYLVWLPALLVMGCQPSGPEPGQQVWEQTCAVCHQNGIAGAPPIGNQAAWAPRIAKGVDTLVGHALNGFEGEEGTMPARGGNTSLTDAQVTDAVKYMISQSQ
ncbi:c-type cytochrome [Corallincola platygyrae]|uniref:C-type cytochrome n=1 Tax=Corallincola platygyrae TaxID=1193278 RepID=A0ABW4XMZ6_9GAMM